MEQRLNTSDVHTPNTGREQDIITANALRDSISKKTYETNRDDRDRLNTLNLDLDIPTSQFMQRQGEMQAKQTVSVKGPVSDKTKSVSPVSQSKTEVAKRQVGM